MSWSAKQFSNADSPRTEILDPDSNATWTRLVQPQKENGEIVSIDEGMQID
jgi:hypothetical protein